MHNNTILIQCLIDASLELGQGNGSTIQGISTVIINALPAYSGHVTPAGTPEKGLVITLNIKLQFRVPLDMT